LYQQFFNFSTAPFSIAPDPHFIYMSEQHQEGLAHLMYGITYGGGFVALTGEVGTGKTTLCHCLLQQLPDNIDIALVLNPKVNAIELLATLCDELHITYDKNKQTLKGLVDSLNIYLLAAHAKGKRTVLVIDEAQNLSLDVLEQVRLLTNLETSTTKLLQIILIGQPELRQLLEKPELRQLNQRITARYHLTSLSYPETQAYIKHRLKVSGGSTDIFSPRAIKKIHRLANGIPRLINILCDRALLGAYVNGSQSVTVDIVNKAAAETFNPVKKSAISLKAGFLATLLAISLIGLSYYLTLKQHPVQQIVAKEVLKKPVAEAVLPKPKLKPIVEVKEQEPAVEILDFNRVLTKRNSTLGTAIPLLAGLWNKELAEGAECREIEKAGLSCLFDKSNWNSLKALNRPVIMEFTASNSEQVYALLVGLEQGKPVFFIDKEIAFPLEQVLSQWNGYYLMLWQPPIPAITEVYPNTSSDAVLWIRSQLTVNKSASINSPLFDRDLKKAVKIFQKTHHLTSDGIVGPRTFIHLQNTDPLDTSPLIRLIN
jgi:general secretion pathway protein A